MNSEPANQAPIGQGKDPLAAPTAGSLEPLFGGLAQLAASVCRTPFSSVTLTGSGETWCSSSAALPPRAVPRHDPFFEHTVRDAGVFEVRDTTQDARFCDAECVAGPLAVRSYAGIALRTVHGEVLGALAVYGGAPGRLTPEQRASLALLAQQGVAQAEYRAKLAELTLLSGLQPRTQPLPAEATLAQALIDSTPRKAESLFRSTFDQAPIGIAYADRNGRFLRCNRAFCTLLGFELGELDSKSIADLTYGEDVACTAAELEHLWHGAVDFVDLEKRYICKDGSTLWVRVTTALVREGISRPECSVEFLRDISTRKELAAALLQQQTLLEAVITDLPVALLASDVAGHITHYNRAAVALLGIQTKDPAERAAPDSHPLAAKIYLADGVTPVSKEDRPLTRALRGETISNLELVMVPRDSTPRTTLSSARRLIGPGGQTLGAVAVIQDTTERKQADLELERVHKQLMSASRQAGMAEVATNVLHNVGNILNSVNISASLVVERVKQSKAPGVARIAALLREKGPRLGEFMANDERGKRVPEYLTTLGEQLMTDQRMALQELASLRDNLEHIKDTVAMQQSYAKLCGVTEIVAVVDLVEDSLRLNAGAFARHGVTLHRDFAEVPPITVDKHKVLQILVNLVRNAKYACDESGKTEKLITLRIDAAANGVRISVIDNGVGIPAENMSRLFTHGFTTRQSGHGFGLHSGALAAQELGGTLRAESDGPGRGAAFILELPYNPSETAHA